MRIGFLEIPNFPRDIYNIVKKSGSRIEYSIRLSDELILLASKISALPLRFASIVKAMPSKGRHQEFHSDSEDGERAIVYLTNVENDLNGPIEFKDHGKILGNAGTFIHYYANEIHRGCTSDIERFALALAFDISPKHISTVGNPNPTLLNPPANYAILAGGNITGTIFYSNSGQTGIFYGNTNPPTPNTVEVKTKDDIYPNPFHYITFPLLENNDDAAVALAAAADLKTSISVLSTTETLLDVYNSETLTIVPGKSSAQEAGENTSLQITGSEIIIDAGGNPNAIFYIVANEIEIDDTIITLINGARSKNVYWVSILSGITVTAPTPPGVYNFFGTLLSTNTVTTSGAVNIYGHVYSLQESIDFGENSSVNTSFSLEDIVGIEGPPGEPGTPGAAGATGPQGNRGLQGAQGISGTGTQKENWVLPLIGLFVIFLAFAGVMYAEVRRLRK